MVTTNKENESKNNPNKFYLEGDEQFKIMKGDKRYHSSDKDSTQKEITGVGAGIGGGFGHTTELHVMKFN